MSDLPPNAAAPRAANRFMNGWGMLVSTASLAVSALCFRDLFPGTVLTLDLAFILISQTVALTLAVVLPAACFYFGDRRAFTRMGAGLFGAAMLVHLVELVRMFSLPTFRGG